MILDYPHGFNLITPSNQRHSPGFGQKDVIRNKWSKKCNTVSFEDEGRGTQAMEREWPLEAKKGKETKSPQEPSPKNG